MAKTLKKKKKKVSKTETGFLFLSALMEVSLRGRREPEQVINYQDHFRG